MPYLTLCFFAARKATADPLATEAIAGSEGRRAVGRWLDRLEELTLVGSVPQHLVQNSS